MNSVQLVGRLTRDPEVRYTDGGLSVARFSLAVDRRFKNENGPTADFPGCIAFGKTAEFIEKYFKKECESEFRAGSKPDSIRIMMEIRFIPQTLSLKIVNLLKVNRKDRTVETPTMVDLEPQMMMDLQIFQMA